jgi:hypothetical protein
MFGELINNNNNNNNTKRRGRRNLSGFTNVGLGWEGKLGFAIMIVEGGVEGRDCTEGMGWNRAVVYEK